MPYSECKCMRREFQNLHTVVPEKTNLIDTMDVKMAEKDKTITHMGTRLAYYESPHMPTSTPSLYHPERKAFRKGRGESVSGDPGEKSDMVRVVGARVGHRGQQCTWPAAMETQYYNLDTDRLCPYCECPLISKSINKMIRDFDGNMHVQSGMMVIEQGECPECGGIYTAENPFFRGSSPDPTAISMITSLFDKAMVDKKIAAYIYEMHGFKLYTNTITGARKTVRYRVEEKVIPRIKEEIKEHPWVGMDETGIKSDKNRGYAWVASTPDAAFVHIVTSRAAAVLSEFFDWLAGKPLVCDGYAAYNSITDKTQRCMRHILANGEKSAMADQNDEACYDMLLAFYKKIKKIKTLAPLTTMHLAREVYSIAASFKDKSTTLICRMLGMVISSSTEKKL